MSLQSRLFCIPLILLFTLLMACEKQTATPPSETPKAPANAETDAPANTVSPDPMQEQGAPPSAMQALIQAAMPKDGKNGYHWVRHVTQTVQNDEEIMVFDYDEDVWVREYQVRSQYKNLRVTRNGQAHESKAADFMRAQVQIRDFKNGRFLILNETRKTWFAQPLSKPPSARSLTIQGYAPTQESETLFGASCEVWDRMELLPGSKRITRACWTKKADTPIALGMPHLVSADGYTMSMTLEMTINSLESDHRKITYTEKVVALETAQVPDERMTEPKDYREIKVDEYRESIPMDGPLPFRQ